MKLLGLTALVTGSFSFLLVSCIATPDEALGVDWPVYGGDPGGMKYSPLTQINRSNVETLELACTWETQAVQATA